MQESWCNFLCLCAPKSPHVDWGNDNLGYECSSVIVILSFRSKSTWSRKAYWRLFSDFGGMGRVREEKPPFESLVRACVICVGMLCVCECVRVCVCVCVQGLHCVLRECVPVSDMQPYSPGGRGVTHCASSVSASQAGHLAGYSACITRKTLHGYNSWCVEEEQSCCLCSARGVE